MEVYNKGARGENATAARRPQHRWTWAHNRGGANHPNRAREGALPSLPGEMEFSWTLSVVVSAVRLDVRGEATLAYASNTLPSGRLKKNGRFSCTQRDFAAY